MWLSEITWSKKADVFEKYFNQQILFKTQTMLFVQIKLILQMKPTDDSRLMNRLIANELIQDLFRYLSYLHQTS